LIAELPKAERREQNKENIEPRSIKTVELKAPSTSPETLKKIVHRPSPR
jgi:hypothetical protein